MYSSCTWVFLAFLFIAGTGSGQQQGIIFELPFSDEPMRPSGVAMHSLGAVSPDDEDGEASNKDQDGASSGWQGPSADTEETDVGEEDTFSMCTAELTQYCLSKWTTRYKVLTTPKRRKMFTRKDMASYACSLKESVYERRQCLQLYLKSCSTKRELKLRSHFVQLNNNMTAFVQNTRCGDKHRGKHKGAKNKGGKPKPGKPKPGKPKEGNPQEGNPQEGNPQTKNLTTKYPKGKHPNGGNPKERRGQGTTEEPKKTNTDTEIPMEKYPKWEHSNGGKPTETHGPTTAPSNRVIPFQTTRLDVAPIVHPNSGSQVTAPGYRFNRNSTTTPSNIFQGNIPTANFSTAVITTEVTTTPHKTPSRLQTTSRSPRNHTQGQQETVKSTTNQPIAVTDPTQPLENRAKIAEHPLGKSNGTKADGTVPTMAMGRNSSRADNSHQEFLNRTVITVDPMKNMSSKSSKSSNVTSNVTSNITSNVTSNATSNGKSNKTDTDTVRDTISNTKGQTVAIVEIGAEKTGVMGHSNDTKEATRTAPWEDELANFQNDTAALDSPDPSKSAPSSRPSFVLLAACCITLLSTLAL